MTKPFGQTIHSTSPFHLPFVLLGKGTKWPWMVCALPSFSTGNHTPFLLESENPIHPKVVIWVIQSNNVGMPTWFQAPLTATA